MIHILHVSAECYPAAKAGGLGDVVGALPKYQQSLGFNTAVVIPLYHLPWMFTQTYDEVHTGHIRHHDRYVYFSVHLVTSADLGYNLYLIHIPGFFDRNGIYAQQETGFPFSDEVDRYLLFQQAALHWVSSWDILPSILHCHDHHTGLVPFMVKYCPDFEKLKNIPTVFTIHNGMYHGAFSWSQMYKLPYFEAGSAGLLDWANTIHPLATGIKCCWALTTVSPNYLRELMYNANGLEYLIRQESSKAYGVLNGIDTQVWNPKSDPLIAHKLKGNGISSFKENNKAVLAESYQISMDKPLFTFIGRLVSEKGADLLPDLIYRYLQTGREACFFILGSGNPQLRDTFLRMRYDLFHFFDASIEYNETLAHQLYAGSDFILMPSRVEPCGLNQLYAFRYGSIPVVRGVGGLWDTVIDAGEPDGRGFRFIQFSVEDALEALIRASNLYYHKDSLQGLRKRIMALDFSWEKSAQEYINIYKKISNL